MIRWIIQALVGLALGGCVPTVAIMKSGPLEAFALGGTDRVGLHDAPRGSEKIELFAAKGEYEPFQIVVRGAEDLSAVQVSVSELKGPNGAVIGKQHIHLYRQHFIGIGASDSSPSRSGNNRPLGPGYYPDALIPFEAGGRTVAAATPFAVRAGTNQPIWVDVFVPRNAPAGVYRGIFSIVHQRNVLEGSLSLRVYNFELPLQPTLRSSFQYWTEKSPQALEVLLQHKLMPEKIPSELQKKFADTYGLNMAGLAQFSGANYSNCTMASPPSVERIRELKSRQQSGLLVYNYTADEIDDCPGLIEPLKAWSRNLRAAGVKNLLVMTPDIRLFDDGTGNPAADIWVVCPGMYEKGAANIAEAQRRGYEVWSYNAGVNCLSSRPFGDIDYPTWQIDFAPINYRIQPGFINQSLDLKGLLYWRVDYWTGDPWNNVNQTCQESKDPCRGYGFPGDGMLVYPGRQVGLEGVVPSMRLKWLREGIEDYEYIETLKKLGRPNAALDISRTVGQDWVNWTKDVAVLEKARRRLGEMIEETKR